MKIQFYTKNIDKSLYRTMIYKFLQEHVDSIPNMIERERVTRIVNEGNIFIYPTTMIEENMSKKGTSISQYVTSFIPGTKINLMIANEITSPGLIEAYVVDLPKDINRASNIVMISHGLGHLLLNAKDPNRYDNLKVPDLSGHPIGWRGKWHTVAVHNVTNFTSYPPEVDRTRFRYILKVYKLLGRWFPVEFYVFNFKPEMQA